MFILIQDFIYLVILNKYSLNMHIKYIFFAFIFFLISHSLLAQNSANYVVPFYSNAYTFPRSQNDSIEIINIEGLKSWKESNRNTKVYFYLTQPIKANFYLHLKENQNACSLLIGFDGIKNQHKVTVLKKDTMVHIGLHEYLDTGYHFIEIRGAANKVGVYPAIRSLIVKDVNKHSILCNNSNYRGAASTHLRYMVPNDSAVQWFYTEVLVPDEVKNSVNAYYETNGFHSGYGGIQINNPKERRFIFSIWSLFKTDDPKQIPKDYSVNLHKKGSGVFTGEFGDEGSGGHSHLVFPWKTNTTYRFLTGITSLQGDSATYIGYYAKPDDNYQWHLLSQWTQHKTDTKTGFKSLYAFVENFGDNGDDFFKAYYSNQWAITFNGTWMELTEAKFTTTANNKTHQRFDYGAGVEDGKFYMFSGGFKKLKNINAGDKITRPATGKHIEIDFKKLEGVE